MTFMAVEFDASTLEVTGRHEIYLAPDVQTAVKHVLYTRKLTDGRSFVGPSGHVVYSGGFGHVVTLSARS